MFFPNKTDFNTIPKSDIKRVENDVNNSTIRKFNYLATIEVFSRLKSIVALLR